MDNFDTREMKNEEDSKYRMISEPILPFTSFSKKFCQRLKSLSIQIVKPIRLRTIYIDHTNDLFIAYQCHSLPLRFPAQLTLPSTLIATTISLLLSPSQAICPGNASTSSTSKVFPFAATAPQTPFPILIVWQATFP